MIPPPMKSLFACLVVSILPSLGAARTQVDQDGGARTPSPPVQETPPLPAASPEALARWEAVLAAARVPGEDRSPIRAFVLEAEVLIREGARTNEMEIEYRYLVPHYIRFRLPGGQETGRGPGSGRRAYWLRDGEEIRRLSGRENAEGRRAVDQMLAVARNYVALSSPEELRLTHLDLLDSPPALLSGKLAKRAKKLDWLRVASPDFALVAKDTMARPSGYAVDLGLERESGLPRMALIRALGSGLDATRLPEPMLILLEEYLERDGFRIPRVVKVHALDRKTASFAVKPAQDIHITDASLRPHLSEADFEPQ